MRSRPLVALALLAVAAATFATVAALANQPGSAAGITRTHDLPSTRIVKIGSSILRLDTRTGAVYLFRGDATSTATGNTWTLRVPPVKEASSGLLDIQILDPESLDGVFLIDVDADATWLLKWRGNENGEWRLIPTF